MNRVRKYNNKYQTLITPYRTSNPDGFSMMLGHWTDEHLKNHRVIEFNDYDDAVEEAIKHPDVEWQRLIEFHKDIYVELYRIIKSDLEDNKLIVELQPKIMTAEELKNTIFDRVLASGKRYTISNDLNDIIGYHIINPWTQNLREIFNILKTNQKLRITKVHTVNNVIRLIGNTSIGTTYEIVLWPTMISQWSRWVSMNPELPEKIKKEALEDSIKTQKLLDDSIMIR